MKLSPRVGSVGSVSLHALVPSMVLIELDHLGPWPLHIETAVYECVERSRSGVKVGGAGSRSAPALPAESETLTQSHTSARLHATVYNRVSGDQKFSL